MPDAPKWSVGDIVYLRESAMIGFLEGYRVTNIFWDVQYNRWIYEASIKHRGTEPNSVIDMHNLRRNEILKLGENDLVNESEALELAIINTQQRLRYLENKKAQLDSINE